MSSLRFVLFTIFVAFLASCALSHPSNPGTRDATTDTREGAVDVVDAGPCGMPGQRCCPTMSGMDGGVVPDAGPQGNGCAVGANCSNGVCMTCPAGRIVCNNDCVDPTQNANCGACGVVCAPGMACMRSGDAGVPSCQLVCPGQTACGGRCADTMTDPMNCGGCGRVCNSVNATNTCVMGQCRFACNMNFANCDSMMTTGCEANLQTDVNNCMSCGRRCQLDNATSACVGGQCRISVCNTGFEDCDTDPTNGCEVNLNTNVANCGRCRAPCMPPSGRNAVCVNGGCGSTPNCAMAGFADCDANGSCETNLTSSPQNCGMCGQPCNSTGGTATCMNSQCGIVCSPGLGNCDNNLSNGCEANTNTNPMNCGRCGTVCNLANATAACTGGTCVVMECRTGFADCDRNPANGCEQATTTDNANCGGCGIQCRGGETCLSGVCRCQVAGTTHCPAANQCFNLTSDTNNCGMCGTVCRVSGQVCQMGTCLCPSSLPVTCGSACVNTTNDVANCGSCGTPCMLSNATSACAAGQCLVVTCNANFGNCNGNNSDGCESDFRTDSNNCGRCGMQCGAGRFCGNGVCVACGSPGAPACPTGTACTASTNCGGTCRDLQGEEQNCGACGRVCNAGQTCCAGVCRTLATDTANCGTCGMMCPTPANATATCAASACGIACSAGFANCDNNVTNGCETNLATPANCGMCGTQCNLPNVMTATCTASTCGIGMCAAGFGNCNTSATDGCETATTTTMNCGACGNACTAGSRLNVTPTCTSGACQFPCQTGFADCDGNVNNGCETDTRTNVAHCGVCRAVCMPPTNAAAACVGGTCGLGTCNANFGNCDGMAGNGCEANLLTSQTHCGACGRACTAGQECQNGTCVTLPCGGNGMICCATAPICTSPLTCQGSACGCASGTFCAGGCIDFQTSNAHCGACNRPCAANQSCTAGTCQCNAGRADCDMTMAGCETDTTTSAAHCGMCGNGCSAVNGTPSCMSSACRITCNTGFGNCDNNVTNGCETNTQTSTTHCGGCGMTCTGGQTCSNGRCCGAGQTNCGGTCVSTQTDNANCGGCAGMGGMLCDNGTQVCSGGSCLACGAAMQPCCPGAVCPRGGICAGGICQTTCGASTQPCCTGNTCGPNFTCNMTTTMCEPCGGAGQPCCNGTTCMSGMCSMGTCSS